MTQKQRYTLLIDDPRRNHTSLWTAACRVNNWPKNDRAFRLKKLSDAVGRTITSTSELNRTDDIDRVFDFLRSAADDLKATHATANPQLHIGRARRLVFKVREVEAELMAYPAHEPMGADGVRRLVQKLCSDIANKGRSRRVEITDVEDLSAKWIEFTRNGKPRKIPSQLDQLLVTLTRILSKYKLEVKAASQFVMPAREMVPAGIDENIPF